MKGIVAIGHEGEPRRIKVKINWVDEKTKQLGVSYVDKYPYDIGGDVFRFEDEGVEWEFFD